jgi:alcohol dehydrogenase, propanol-preferring
LDADRIYQLKRELTYERVIPKHLVGACQQIFIKRTTASKMMLKTMSSARIHDYQKPLVIEQIQTPTVKHGHQVIVRVEACGLCHSDLHLINGDWKDSIPLKLPIIPGHEIAGRVEEIGNAVPKQFVQKDDMVAVYGGWGCGVCIYCKSGDEQSCTYANWPGIMTNGGFAEYMAVDSYRFLVKINETGGNKSNQRVNGRLNTMEEIAPLTDAGLTPYRAIKKVRSMLGPGKSIAIVGIGGLGFYAIQYAKILGQSSDVIALDMSDEKLELAQEVGADHVLKISSSSASASQSNLPKIKEKVSRITDGKGIDVIVDCVGAENTIYDSLRLLNKGGALVVVGLFGNQIKAPLVAFVINEYKIYGSLWGSYNELREVVGLAANGKLKHKINKFPLSDINKAIDLLKAGKIIGRAVIIP